MLANMVCANIQHYRRCAFAKGTRAVPETDGKTELPKAIRVNRRLCDRSNKSLV
jgi:hypothetical protein